MNRISDYAMHSMKLLVTVAAPVILASASSGLQLVERARQHRIDPDHERRCRGRDALQDQLGLRG